MKVFTVFLHAHLLGVGIKARHIRGDVELPPIAEDDTYDFDFQDTRTLSEEREIKHGDSITVECTYDSTGKTQPTLGGLPTTSEMCLAFLYYYPKHSIDRCLSEPLYMQIDRNAHNAVNRMYSWDWNDKSVRDKFHGILKTSKYDMFCYDSSGHRTSNVSGIREPTTKYVPPARQCPSS